MYTFTLIPLNNFNIIKWIENKFIYDKNTREKFYL